ncbi:hypothetical protein ASPVEDRAFT_23757 [Aspergillus versicolor CBS 583.65]|uniref:Tyrosinase copper-binding domain-containing protein n=1 Tax=Aspergillus versicolor CBS 583.65 TaxID=1036611 RepID=A0A1L9P5K4_ASPVE|nr:uncharacterized protein ASPVEDRAFT_23757 [Aspergillus versicolor CBS 583.65]OJI96766.1 hypothetical protein ASPVEDRAFT_23757 [Aspergillus versicolor CBS 583.65]
MHLSLLALVLPLAAALPYQKPPPCTPETAIQRKEWSSSSPEERRSYIDAVKCLMDKPSIYPPGTMPASTSYFTDFAASHAGLSLSIHSSGTFLSWHREFVALFESALHECSYPSHLGIPYWDWPLYTDRPLIQSTLFDGSPTSLGGNGLPLPEAPPSLALPGAAPPAGTWAGAGGCIASGPFANISVSLGPLPGKYSETGLPSNWTQANPHCLARDLNDVVMQQSNNKDIVDKVFSATGITEFQEFIATPHTGGHNSGGGKLSDFFTSPADPVFYLHHAQIDRVWAIWQAGEEGRRESFNGTSTFRNPIGVTPEVDGDTVMSFGVVGGNTTLREVADPMAGKYCYAYV